MDYFTCCNFNSIILLYYLTSYALQYWTFYSHSKKIYEINWSIALPDDMKMVSDKRTSSFHGDGIRHTVYSFHGDEKYFSDFKTIPNYEVEEECLEIWNSLQQEENAYAPDFQSGYKWKEYRKSEGRDFLIFIYFPDKKELHLFQEIM